MTAKNYLEDLNTAQKNAVKHINGPLMIIAGPGSGKTRVLTSRILFLLQNNISPFNILALTFTNKAAKEMRKRIEESANPTIANSLWMGTFHSIFSKILRFESEKINYPSNFTIYDTDDSKSLIRSIIKELKLDKDIYKVGVIRNRISALKNNFITSEDYKTKIELIKSDEISKRTEFFKIYTVYEERCKRASAMDFDDLLLKTYQLLELDTETLLKYQEKFKYILIDEYQDTNHIQYLIIKKLAAMRENICIVGDDAQSIYSFRGANIHNILNFKLDYPDYTTYKLEQNYRSTSIIVDAANSVIRHNKNQIKKTVWTSNKKGNKIIVAKTHSDNEEGILVANTIIDIRKKADAEWQHFAILYRTNAQSRSIEEALRKRNIAYKIYGGLSFYQRKEVKDLLAYFRLAINPNDEEAIKRIINYPKRGIGLTTIQKISIYSNNKNSSIWETINNIENTDININKGTKEKLKEFAMLVNHFILISKTEDAYTSAENITKKSGVFYDLKNDNTPEGISRFENIQELLNGIKEFSDNMNKENNKISNFMEDVALLTDQDKEEKDDSEKVTLMTIHAAKGLEFPYVFIVGLEENLFPSMMSNESEEALEEERRLFYVAITRAEKRLFLSFTSSRFRWGQFIDCQPSRFLSDIDQNYIEKYESEVKKEQYKNYKIYAKTKKNPQIKNHKTKIPSKYKKLKSIEKKLKNPQYIEETPIIVGTKVEHATFGIGEVISISGEGANKKATIQFNDYGEKQLLLQFAKLKTH